MGWFDEMIADIGEAFEDVGEAVVDFVEDVVEVVVDVVEDIVDVVEDVVEVVVDVAEDVADWTLNVLDDTVFDTVDFLTGGVIDVDYDDGQFTAGLDIGIASVGISIGEQGFSAEAGFDVGLASGEISYDSDDGFAASGSLGVDWGPLPYAEGHLTIGTDGSVSIGGEFQASLPLPFGEISFETSGGFERNPDGSWGAYSDAALDVDGAFGDLHLATDTRLEGDASGVRFESNLDAEAGMFGAEVRGGGTIAGSVAADGSRDLSAEARAGMSAGDKDIDARAGFAHAVDASGVAIDVLTGAVIVGQDGATVLTAGGNVVSTQGLGASSVTADGWVDAVGDQTPRAVTDSSSALSGTPTGVSGVPDDAIAPVPADNFVPADNLVPTDNFVPTDDFGSDDLGQPIAEPFVIPQLLPEPPPVDEFSSAIAMVEEGEEQAEDLWNDI